MAESSIMWTTNNTGDGPTAGYTQTQLFQLFRSLSRTANLGGVFPDVLNELAVTGTATPVSVNTGQAICYGIPYFNSAAVTVAISTPASLTRVDYIVLRASWAAQTVRIARIAGTEGAGAPALVQTPGTTWDIPLATVSITTGAVITVTDAREWATGAGDNTIDNTKLAQAAANTMKGNFTGSTANLTDTSVATVLAAYAANIATALGISTGTFTPTLLIDDSATGITYDIQTGQYWKVGTLVFFDLYIDLSSKGASVGGVKIGGLPFAVASDDLQIPFDAAFASVTSAMRVLFEPLPSTSTLKGRIMTANAVTNFGAAYGGNLLANTDMGNGTVLAVRGQYKTT